MSLVSSRVSTLEAELRLAQAISEFQRDLTAGQKAEFCSTRDTSVVNPPNYKDVMRLTEEIDRTASRVLKSRRCFGTRFTNVLHAIQQFAALGDVIVGGSQNILACGVWSLVRMTLLTVVNFSSYFEKLSSILMNVGRSAPRYEMLNQLYPRSKALQSHLSEYFIVVVRVCHELLKMTRKSTLGQLMTFPSEADLKAHESELESISSLIKGEVTLLMGQEVREQNLRIRRILRSTEVDAERQRQDTYLRVLDACSTYDYETTWKETRKLGMTSLFQQATEYGAWMSSTESATLVCTGKLGSGKTVMLANIVGDLILNTGATNCPVAYFFCRHDIDDSLLASTIIRSLGRQLLRSVPDLRQVDQRFKTSGQVVDSGHVLAAILSLPTTFRAYFVLDGLDECTKEQRLELIDRIRRIQDVFSLRVCVACRSDADNNPAMLLKYFARSSVMALPTENPEIKSFIEDELYRCVESGRLVLGDPQLSLEIADALTAGAQGMFLWVALQIDALCGETSDEAIRHCLAELPGTLEGTFSRALDRATKYRTGRRDYSRTVFEIVIAAKRPLTTDELCEALSVAPGDDEWNPARHLNSVFPALACCGSLIMVEEESLTVRLIHHSVKKFLIGENLSGRITSMNDAERTMRSIILTYLNYGVFETQLSTFVTQPMPAQQAPSKIIRSMDTRSISRTIALRLLKARAQPSVDIGQVVSQTMRSAKLHKSQTPDAHTLYPYAKSSWLHHSQRISENETATYTMLVKVVRRVLGSSATTDRERNDILLWAAERGHKRILALCVELGLDIDSKEPEFGTTPIFWAVRNGHHAAVKFLASQGVNVDCQDIDGRTPLSWAAQHGLGDLVQTLLDYGANPDVKDGRDWTPLTFAASCGETIVVRTLLDRGSNLSSYASIIPSRRPLTRAVINKNADIAAILLEVGADRTEAVHALCMSTAIQARDLPTLKVLLSHAVDSNIDTADGEVGALCEALSTDNIEIVRMLLSHGADPNKRDKLGRTPLITVVVKGLVTEWEAMINILLDAGADLDATDKEGKTALWHAATHGEARVVQALVGHKCDRNVTALDGTTAWHIGETPGQVARIRVLLVNKFDVNLKDGKGRTPLHYAAECGDVEAAKLLLHYGANPEELDHSAWSPLQIATTRKHEAVMLLLDRHVQSYLLFTRTATSDARKGVNV
jgi:ankyrin repeat protein